MSILTQVKARAAAKSLDDIDITESSWKPDFDLIDRFQGFANELMRISLLGIVGYGFLISEICMKDPRFLPLLATLQNNLLIGAASLGLCMICVLIYRFISSDCLFYQVLILRSLKRSENQHWSHEERENESLFLQNTRRSQRDKSLHSRYVLIGAAFFDRCRFLFCRGIYGDNCLFLAVFK